MIPNLVQFKKLLHYDAVRGMCGVCALRNFARRAISGAVDIVLYNIVVLYCVDTDSVLGVASRRCCIVLV